MEKEAKVFKYERPEFDGVKKVDADVQHRSDESSRSGSEERRRE